MSFSLAGVHPLQGISGCWWEDKSGATDSSIQYGYDGEDFGVIHVPNRLSGKDVLDITRAEGKELFLQNCIVRLKVYLQCGKGCLDRIGTAAHKILFTYECFTY